MRLTVVNLLALAASTAATPVQQINNYCPESKYIGLTLNATGAQTPFRLPTRQAYVGNITGVGNVVNVANISDSFNAPRLELAYSIDESYIIYW
jgi:hypothetical protein